MANLVVDPIPELLTVRLRLRAARPDDAELLLPLYGSSEVLRYIPREPLKTPDEFRAKLASDDEERKRGEAVRWAVTLRGDDRPFAYVGLFRWNQPHRYAEVGYAMLPSSWGHGFMTEMLPPMLGFGFSGMGLHRIEAFADPKNLPSTRVLERAGFKLEGLMRERTRHDDGSFADLAVYGLVAPSR